MAFWRFFDYWTCPAEGERNLIQEWYDAQEDAVQAQFDATLFTLAATEDWTDPELEEFKVLTGRHLGLGEIRFAIDVRPAGRRQFKRRFRPVGIWPPEHLDFIILLGCEKSGRGYSGLSCGSVYVLEHWRQRWRCIPFRSFPNFLHWVWQL